MVGLNFFGFGCFMFALLQSPWALMGLNPKPMGPNGLKLKAHTSEGKEYKIKWNLRLETGWLAGKYTRN